MLFRCGTSNLPSLRVVPALAIDRSRSSSTSSSAGRALPAPPPWKTAQNAQRCAQPTLVTEVAELQDRIFSTARGAITSVQAVYVPADDMSDPAVNAILSHLDTTVILSRVQASKGIYPAVDPLRSASKLMDRHVLGERHYAIAQGVREHLARYRELEDIIVKERVGGSVRLGDLVTATPAGSVSGVLALLAALCIRLHETCGTFDVQRMRRLKG